MTKDEMLVLFEKHDDEYLQDEGRRSDLAAFNLLDKLVPGTGDIVAGAEHDEIYLDTDVEALAAVATEQDVIELIRCGVRYDDDTDGFAMYA